MAEIFQGETINTPSMIAGEYGALYAEAVYRRLARLTITRSFLFDQIPVIVLLLHWCRSFPSFPMRYCCSGGLPGRADVGPVHRWRARNGGQVQRQPGGEFSSVFL